jgi:hypothetical protein
LLANGFFYLDKNAYILYRQHGNNVIGGIGDKSATIKRHLKLATTKQSSNIRFRITKELLTGFRNLASLDNLSILEIAVNYRNSWIDTLKFAFSKKCIIKNKKIRRNFILSVLRRKF